MTRLVESDVRGLTARLPQVEATIRAATGLDFVGVAARARRSRRGRRSRRPRQRDGARRADHQRPGRHPRVHRVRRRRSCGHVGCAAAVTAQSDVAGFAEAFAGGATLVFAADDFRFLAVNAKRGWTADNDPCTAARLRRRPRRRQPAASRASRSWCSVSVRSASRRRGDSSSSARNVFACEPDESRLAAARAELPLEPVSLDDGLAHCWLVYDATPVAGLIDARWVWADCAVAAPGLPPAVTRRGGRRPRRPAHPRAARPRRRDDGGLRAG